MYTKLFIFALLGTTILFAQQQVNAESDQQALDAKHELISFFDTVKGTLNGLIEEGKNKLEETKNKLEEAKKNVDDELEARTKELLNDFEKAKSQGKEHFDELMAKLRPVFEEKKDDLLAILTVLTKGHGGNLAPLSEI